MHAVHFCPALEALPPDELDVLFRHSVTRRLSRGEIVVFRGDPPGDVALIESGVVKLVAPDASGAEAMIDLLVEGELIGEIALLDGEAQMVSAVAATPGCIRRLSGPVLLETLRRNPAAAFALSTSIAARLRRMTGCAIDRHVDAPARVAGRLLDLCLLVGRMRGGRIDIDLPLGQAELAQLAATSRETTCRTMRNLRRRGIVDYERSTLRILRPDMLERIRCGKRALKR